MTDEEIIRQACELHAEAGHLLYGEGLLSLIEHVGTARIIGSFALDLMTWPDIDISVLLPYETDIPIFFDLGKELATKFQVTRMVYSNAFIRPDQPFDHGLYWGVRLLYESKTWKVDLWGYGDNAYQTQMSEFDELEQLMRNADRLAALRIKNEICRRPEYRKDIYSTDVYDAVARHGIRTVDGFDGWISERHKRGDG